MLRGREKRFGVFENKMPYFPISSLFLLIIILVSSQYGAGNETTQKFKLTGKRTLSGIADLALHASLVCTDSYQPQLLVRTQTHLFFYNAGDSTKDSLSPKWNKFMPGTVRKTGADQYPLELIRTSNFGQILLTKVESGLRFYKIENTSSFFPKPLSEDGKFANVYGWNEPSTFIKWGRIYPTNDHLGVLTRNKNGNITFYSIPLQSLINGELFPVRVLAPSSPLEIEKHWSHKDTEFHLVQIHTRAEEQEVIVVRSAEKFSIYKFDSSYQPKRFLEQDQLSKLMTKDGSLIFAHLTKSLYKDILLFNVAGLYIWKYNETRNSYDLVWEDHTHFSEASGWNRDHTTSIKPLDLDGDGVDEIIYYGPSGLGITKFIENANRNWTLIEIRGGAGLSLKEKYSYPRAVNKCGKTGQPLLLLEDDDYKLYLAELRLEAVTKPNSIQRIPTTSSPPTWTPSFPVEKKSKRIQKWQNWFDLWGDTLLGREDLINLATGQIQWTLSLFSAHGINLWLSYHSTRQMSSGPLGVGWSLPIAKDYIFVETKSSLFEEVHSFYLSLDGAMLQLNMTYDPTSPYKTFNIPTQNVNLSFFAQNQSWIMEGEESTLIFGGTEQAIQQSLVWPWGYHGDEKEVGQLSQQTVAWYLTQRLIKRGTGQGQKVEYKYKAKMEEVGQGTFYTKEIYLEQILDRTNSISVSFEYTPKEGSEVTPTTPKNPDGSLSFPVPLSQTMALSSIYGTTPISKQRYNFTYSTVSGKRRLESVLQFYNSDFSPLLQFGYFENDGNQTLLSYIAVPSTGLREVIQYNKFQQNTTSPIVFPLNEMGNLNQGPGYLVLHYRNRIPEDAIKLDIYTTEGSIQFCQLSTEPITSGISRYSVAPYGSLIFVMIEESNGGKRVDVFTRNSSASIDCGGWSPSSSDSFSYGNSTLIGATSSFIASVTPGQSEVNLFISNEQRLYSQSVKLANPLGEAVVVVGQESYLAIYDNINLILIHRVGDKWISSSFPAYPGFFKKTANFFNNFDINLEWRSSLTHQVTQATLKARDNFILLSALEMVDDSAYLRLQMLELSSDYKVLEKWNHFIKAENVLELSQVLNNQEGSNFTIKYSRQGALYKLGVAQVQGKIREGVDSIRNRNRKQDALEALLKEINDHDQWKQLLRSMSLLTWTKYGSSFSSGGLCIGNETLIHRDGKVGTIPSTNNIRVGPHLTLIQEEGSGSKYHLVETETGKQLQAFSISPAWNIIPTFPFFIAYQTGPNVIVLPITRDGKGVRQPLTLQGERLHPLTGSGVGLVTTRSSVGGSSHASSREIVVRSSSTFQNLQLFTVSKVETKSSFDGLRRATGYEYDGAGNRIRITPGALRTLSGWMDTFFFENNRTTLQQFYNTNGSLVKSVAHETKLSPSQGTSFDDISKDYILTDSRGELTILNSAPYKVSDDMVDFTGFEEYEQTSKWNYDPSQIVRGRLSFTGQSYLELTSPTSTLHRTFTPKYRYESYIASCWIREGFPSIRVGEDVPFFKVIYLLPNSTEIIGLHGKVRKILGDWIYSEVVMDLGYAMEEIYTPVLGSVAGNLSSPITLKIVVAPSTDNPTIHVDNIAFYPSYLDFSATVYSLTKRLNPIPTEKLGSGSLTRILYDRKGNKISDCYDGAITYLKSLQPISPKNRENSTRSSLYFETKSGFYELWEKSSFQNRWELEGASTLSVSSDGIAHEGGSKGKFTLRGLSTKNSFLLRFDYAFEAGSSLGIKLGGVTLTLENRAAGLTLSLNGKSVWWDKSELEGELIVLIVGHRVVVWINTQIILDQSKIPRSASQAQDLPLSIELVGGVQLAGFFLLENPSLKVTYYNGLNEPIQELTLESENSVIAVQTLYDQLGRPYVKSRETRITQKLNDPLLKYYPRLVTSFDPSTKRIHGELNTAHKNDDGFPYYFEEYEDHPQGLVLSRGLPGKEYALGGRYGFRTETNVRIPFIQNLLPGAKLKRRSYPNGKQIAWVYKDKMVVAVYIKAPNYDHRLTTYDYENEKLVKILPPSYHKAANTFSRLHPWDSNTNFGSIEQTLQNVHGTFFTYNDAGKLKTKTTREEGSTHFMYDGYGSLRFRVVQPFGSSHFSKTMFTYFDPSGILVSSGIYTKSIQSLSELEPYLGDEPLPLKYTYPYQDFDYSEHDPNSSVRRRGKQVITNNDGNPVVEEIVYDSNEEVIRKSIFQLPTLLSSSTFLTFSKLWVNGSAEKFCYPSSDGENPFCVIKVYNKLGQLVSITGPQTRFNFDYNAKGQVVKESSPDNSRKFEYNSPGFLTSIEDSFSALSLTYEGKGYTQAGQGGGIVTGFEFDPKWKETSMNKRKFLLEETTPPEGLSNRIWKLCLAALRRTGHLSAQNIPTGKLFLISTELALPLQCRGRVGYQLSQILAQSAPPEAHGYKVDYGSHGEVLRAKYTTPSQNVAHEPLQPLVFSRIPGISTSSSLQIWNRLVEADLLIVNQPTKNTTTHIGTLSDISLFREGEIEDDLKSLDIEASQFSEILTKLLGHYLLTLKQSVRYEELESKILQWSGFVDKPSSQFLINKRKLLSRRIYDGMIVQRGYGVSTLLSQTFLDALGPYRSESLDIAKVLLNHHHHSLGSHPFDIDVLDVDMNGNRQTFLRSHSIYDIMYRNDSVNQIATITQHLGASSVAYNVTHDPDGNVIQAPHKGIHSIEYHPITKRPTTIQMEDGTSLIFLYDGQGERILKQVTSPSGYLTKEITYLRDERGRVLTERGVSRDEDSDSVVATTLTHFIYGPRSLLGFVRDGAFYSVTTDHLGSIRLITRGHEVVVAVDYMPYGGIQKGYVADPKCQINYGFAGKEWDAETQLYNFHARLYDPTLGRFFQTDSMWQYSSPYIYAGNSPFSLVDPDGEEVITLIVLGIIGAGVGGYLGGAAVNNRWNPADWDFRDPGTYFGIGGGALAGALLPVGFAGSVGVIGGVAGTLGAGATASTVIGVTGTVTLGTGVAYLTTSASNNKWNPAEWEWDRPHTYNAIIQGFAIGSSIPAGVSGVHKLATKIAGESTKLKALLITSNFVVGGGVAYGMGVTANAGQTNPMDWEWSSPRTISSLAIGFYSGYAWPTLIAGSGKGIHKLFSTSSSLKWNGAMIKAALKNPKSPIYKTIGGVAGAYMIGSMANEDFDITSWNFKSFTTYQGILNGVFMGKGITLLIHKLTTPAPPKWRIDYDNLPRVIKDNPVQFWSLVSKAVKQMLYRELKSMFGLSKKSAKSATSSSSSSSSSSTQDIYREAQRQSQLLEQRLTQRSPSSERIRADRTVSGIPCLGTGLPRVRRALGQSCLLPMNSRSQKAQIDLQKNLPTFLSQTPLSTLQMDVQPITVFNNQVVRFNLQGLVANPKAYVLAPTSVSFAHNIAAYYLGTTETIQIPAFPDGQVLGSRVVFNRLVVTPELGGCSLYVKHNPDSNTISIFHHSRGFEKQVFGEVAINQNPITGHYRVLNPKTGLVEEYTDVLSYEEYHRPSSSNPERPLAASTAMIYFDFEKGSWNFANQMISYSLTSKGGIGSIALEGFKSRVIYGIPWVDGTVFPPPAPRPPGA